MARHLLGVLDRASTVLGSQAWARRLLDSEEANLAVALQWAAQPPVFGQLLRRLGDVWVWSLVRGNLRRSTALRQQVESWPDDEPDRLARQFLLMIGGNEDGRWAEVAELVDRSLPDIRRAEEPTWLGLMLTVRALGPPYAADSPARAEYAEALAVARAASGPLVAGYVQTHYGSYLCVDGDVPAARTLHEAALRAARAYDDENLRAEAHYFLAMDSLAAGDPDPVYSHLATAARYYADIDHRDGLTRSLGMLGALALDRGLPQLAARLAGATAAARDDIRLAPWPAVAEGERRVARRVQGLLPADEYAGQLAAGRAIRLEPAISEALSALAGDLHATDVASPT
jgi:hypothetical protein